MGRGGGGVQRVHTPRIAHTTAPLSSAKMPGDALSLPGSVQRAATGQGRCTHGGFATPRRSAMGHRRPAAIGYGPSAAAAELLRHALSCPCTTMCFWPVRST